MIEEAVQQLSKLTGQEFFVHEGKIVASLTVNDDWDALFESLTEHCDLTEWNGAFIPGIEGFFNHPNGKDVYQIAIVYCGSCCG